MLNELQRRPPNQCFNDHLHDSDPCTELRLTIENVFMFCFSKYVVTWLQASEQIEGSNWIMDIEMR